MNFGDEESPRFFAEPALGGTRFFAALRMTRGEGLRMRLHPVIAEHLKGCVAIPLDPLRLLRRYAPRKDAKEIVIASEAWQSDWPNSKHDCSATF